MGLRTASYRRSSAAQVVEPSRHRHPSLDAVPFRRSSIRRTTHGKHRGILEARKGGSRMCYGPRKGTNGESLML